MRKAKTLISLGGCPGLSESSLSTQVILLVLSCCGSNGNFQGSQCEETVTIVHSLLMIIIIYVRNQSSFRE